MRVVVVELFFFCKQKTAYEMRISDWSSDVCSSDLANGDPANDRGGLSGDRLTTGYDPTDSGFYHGGDLKGLTDKLSYIARLGATAVWVGPIFKNKPVQGPKGQESAAYHGYWITDFTTVDPHFGTEDDFRRFVDRSEEHTSELQSLMRISYAVFFLKNKKE